MWTRCRVDGIEESRPTSHSEFAFRSVIYTITRLADGRAFRVRMPRRTEWQPGDLVTVANAALEDRSP